MMRCSLTIHKTSILIIFILICGVHPLQAQPSSILPASNPNGNPSNPFAQPPINKNPLSQAVPKCIQTLPVLEKGNNLSDPNCVQQVYYRNKTSCRKCAKNFQRSFSLQCLNISSYNNPYNLESSSDCGLDGISNSRGDCQQLGPNCRLYTSCGQCLSCYPGFINLNGKCRPRMYGLQCLTPSCLESLCNQLPSSSRSYGSGCVSVDSHCVKVKENGKCVECAVGYMLKAYSCVTTEPVEFKVKEERCQIWEKGKCVWCEDQWEETEEGTCKKTGRKKNDFFDFHGVRFNFAFINSTNRTTNSTNSTNATNGTNATTNATNQTVNGSNSSANSSNTTNTSNITANVSNATNNVSNQSANTSNITANGSNQSNQSGNTSNQSANASNQSNSSNQSVNSSNQTANTSNQSTNISNQSSNTANLTLSNHNQDSSNSSNQSTIIQINTKNVKQSRPLAVKQINLSGSSVNGNEKQQTIETNSQQTAYSYTDQGSKEKSQTHSTIAQVRPLNPISNSKQEDPRKLIPAALHKEEPFEYSNYEDYGNKNEGRRRLLTVQLIEVGNSVGS